MYISPFRLIQTGIITDSDTFVRLDDFVSWRYMGAAEFEFGALGKSLTRILYRVNEYKIFETSLISADGKRLMVYTRDSTIPQKIVEFADRVNPRIYYDTKEPTFLEDVRSNPAHGQGQTSFWFCIDNSTAIWNNRCGDWMALFEDDVPGFLKVMENEKKLWYSLSQSERESYLSKADIYE